MHGIIFAELQKYVDAKLGPGKWQVLVKEAGLGSKLYLANQEYPDSEVVALVVTASRLTGLEAAVILEDFGQFIAPDLIGMYRAMIKPDWKTLEVIENTEATVHKAVRLKDPSAKPPELQVTRSGPQEVVITYRSPRKLCAVAKGIAKGLAKHYRETISISESTCMLKGAAACRIAVRRS